MMKIKLTILTIIVISLPVIGCKMDGNDEPDPSSLPDITEPHADRGIDYVTVMWTDPEDPNFAEIAVEWEPGGPGIQTVGTGTETFTAEGLSKDTEYTFTIRTVDSEGTRSEGMTLEVSTGAPGKLKWTYENTDISMRTAIGGDGTIYTGGDDYDSTDGVMVALYPSGREKWIVHAEGSGGVMPTVTGGAVSPDGTVYFSLSGGGLGGIYGGGVAAVDLEGSVKWLFEPGAEFESAPSILKNESINFVYALTKDYLYALNPDGSINRQWTNYGTATDRPFLLKDRYYVAEYYSFSFGGLAYDIDPGSSDPAFDSNRNMYNSSNNGFVKIDTIKDEEVWQISTSENEYPVIGADGTIYAMSSWSGTLAAISPDNGEVLWTYDGDFSYSGAAVGADGTIFATTETGITAINPDGTLKWSSGELLDDKNVALGDHGLVIGPTGTLYTNFRYQDNNRRGLLAVFSESGGPSEDSPWPMVGRDMQNTAHLP